MLRFIFNFIIFGIIFFLIWKFQPHWIEVMRSWAESVYDVVIKLASVAIEKLRTLASESSAGGSANG